MSRRETTRIPLAMSYEPSLESPAVSQLHLALKHFPASVGEGSQRRAFAPLDLPLRSSLSPARFTMSTATPLRIAVVGGGEYLWQLPRVTTQNAEAEATQASLALQQHRDSSSYKRKAPTSLSRSTSLL